MNDFLESLTAEGLASWPVLGIAVMVAIGLSWLAFAVLRRVLARQWISRSAAGFVLRRAEPGLRLALPALAVVVLLGLAPVALPLLDVAQRLATVVLVVFATLTVTQVITALGEWVIQSNPASAADNLSARQLHTRVKVIARTASTVAIVVGVAIALMTFPAARKFGVSLLASAGVAGLVVGLAAKSVLGNLLAGLQIAISQPIRIDDVVVVEGEWGRIDEITSTYVVVRIWDERRLVVPLQWFIEHPFQNWTRSSADILGSVLIWLDYDTPLAPLRAELERLAKAAPQWDGRVCVLQVTDTSAQAMQVRALVSSADAGRNWDLRCRIREGLIEFLRANHPEALPRLRIEVDPSPRSASPAGTAH